MPSPLRAPLILAALGLLLLPAGAAAGRWSPVPLPRHTAGNGITCLSTRWCEAVGGWGNRLAAGHWNGRRWSTNTNVPTPRGASLNAIACRSATSCVAVGDVYASISRPITPLVERWNGRRWSIEAAPAPTAPRGFHGGVNARLMGVTCPGRRLCFAVGQAVALGSGGTPGIPLIERWDGRRWTLVRVPAGPSPLDAVACTSTRACTAVGAFEYTTGPPDGTQQTQNPTTIERWNGRRWLRGGLTGTAAPEADGLLGVACTSPTRCLGVGYQINTDTFARQALAATGDGLEFAATALAFPATAYRGGAPGTPQTRLYAVSCAPTDPDFCAAVGSYNATNGAVGPLGALWNGATWSQVALRRGPVQLDSVSCPALGWCMAVGGGIAEVWR